MGLRRFLQKAPVYTRTPSLPSAATECTENCTSISPGLVRVCTDSFKKHRVYPHAANAFRRNRVYGKLHLDLSRPGKGFRRFLQKAPVYTRTPLLPSAATECTENYTSISPGLVRVCTDSFKKHRVYPHAATAFRRNRVYGKLHLDLSRPGKGFRRFLQKAISKPQGCSGLHTLPSVRKIAPE
jgi:hypothetical protein